MMSSNAIVNRLVRRLQAPQVAVRLSREEMLLTMGSLASMYPSPAQRLPQPEENKGQSVGLFRSGVLDMRATQMARGVATVRELSILARGASSLAWSPSAAPHFWDAVCAKLRELAGSAERSGDAKGDSAVGSEVVSLCRMVRQSSDESARCDSDDDSMWVSLTLQGLVEKLPLLMHPDVQLRRDDVTCIAWVMTRRFVRKPTAALTEWLCGQITKTSKADAVDRDDVLTGCLRQLLNIGGSWETTVQVALQALHHPEDAQNGDQVQDLVFPLWAADEGGHVISGRAALLRAIVRLSGTSSDPQIVLREIVACLRKYVDLDVRDDDAVLALVAALTPFVQTQTLASSSPASDGGSASVVPALHEALYIARKVPALDAIVQLLQPVLPQSTTSLRSLEKPQQLLLRFHSGETIHSSELYEILNEAVSYSFEQNAIVLYLFPHRVSECDACTRALTTNLRHLSGASASELLAAGITVNALAMVVMATAGASSPSVSELCSFALTSLTQAVRKADCDDFSSPALISLVSTIAAGAQLHTWESQSPHGNLMERLDSMVAAAALRLIEMDWSAVGEGTAPLHRALGHVSIALRKSGRRVAQRPAAEVVDAHVRRVYDLSRDRLLIKLQALESSSAVLAAKSCVDSIALCIAFDTNDEALMDSVRSTLTPLLQTSDAALLEVLAVAIASQCRWRAPELDTLAETFLQHASNQSELVRHSGVAAAALACAIRYRHQAAASAVSAALLSSDLSPSVVFVETLIESLRTLPQASIANREHAADAIMHCLCSCSSYLSSYPDLKARVVIAAEAYCRSACSTEMHLPAFTRHFSTIFVMCTEVVAVAPVTLVPHVLRAAATFASQSYVDQSQCQALLAAVCERLERWVCLWTPRDVAVAVSSIGELPGVGAQLAHQTALQNIAEFVVDHESHFFSGRDICAMLLGFAKAHITTRSLYRVFADRLRHRAVMSLLQTVDINCALQAFGIVKFADKNLLDLFGKRVLADKDCLTANDIVAVASSFSRMMLLHDTLYKTVGDRAAEIAESFSTSEAALLLSSYGHVGVRHQRLGDTVLHHLSLGEASAVEAAHMIVGLWQMHFEDNSNKLDALADRIADCKGEGLSSKELAGLCSVARDLNWRHPRLLRVVGTRAATLVAASSGEDVRPLTGDCARIVLDTLSYFSIHHSDARALLSPMARAVSRDIPELSEEERQMLLGS